MRTSTLESATIIDLVNLFVQRSLEQDQADLREEQSRWTVQYRRLESITKALKDCPGDQRHQLIPLYEHKNAQVRVNAAMATLAVAPTAARATLERIVQWDVGSQRVQALDMLSALDRGNYVPS